MPIEFKIEKKLNNRLGRAGLLKTPNGEVQTPFFVVVGTKASVKALSPEQLREVGTEMVLANTYHLYLQPGEDTVAQAGGLGHFMNWGGPTMTDSGGFQVFSLGEGFGDGISKFTHNREDPKEERNPAVYSKELASSHGKLALVDEEGVTFTSHLDGSMHRFIPERSVEIQHKLGADIIVAFDECTSPKASYDYQKEALERTTRWAKRSLDTHRNNLEAKDKQGIFGVVQGGRYEDLRKKSAEDLANLDFDGFGIGGSFSKKDLDEALIWVNEILPDEKPRHLLGIGEPEDIFLGVEHGVDMFDCVAPTRIGRNGGIYTRKGKINITKSSFKEDLMPLESDCSCYTCKNFTRSYLHHLFRAGEMFAATLASIHNVYFIVNLVKNIRESIMDENFFRFRDEFLGQYK